MIRCKLCNAVIDDSSKGLDNRVFDHMVVNHLFDFSEHIGDKGYDVNNTVAEFFEESVEEC